MAFFEQIGKKLTDAGQGVAQQTKNLADVTRLNVAIAEKERKITQLYSAIGQAYYEKHKDDPDVEIPEIAEVNALVAEIAQSKQEINQIKGVQNCPACGAEIADTAAFCTSCGTKVAKDEEG